MSLFDKYKPYLYDMVEEPRREKLGMTMFTQLATLTSNAENGGTPNVYLGAFTKAEMGFVGDLFGTFVKETDYDKGVNYNKEILNDLVAGYALNTLWLAVQKDFGTAEKIKASLQNKEDRIPESLCYFKDGEDAAVNPYLQVYGEVGIRIESLTLGDDLSCAFDKLSEFYTLLNIPVEEFSEAKRRAAIESLAKTEQTQFTNSMLGVLIALYESGFTGFPQEGIMVYNSDNVVQSPITRVRQSQAVTKSTKNDKGIGNDIDIINALTKANPSLKVFCPLSDSTKDYVPNISYFLSMAEQRQSFVCPNLHLMFQSADITYSRGNISINNWIKETTKMSVSDWKEKYNGGKNIIQKWSDVQKWYKWALDTLFLDALMQYNVNGQRLEGLPSERGMYKKILGALINGLANVVVVSERDNKKYSKTELRIASQTLKTEQIKTVLDAEINVAGMEAASFEDIRSSSGYVSIVRVVYDKAEANKGALFAGDVIDSFIESGNIPSWSHALIGKKEDGSLFFWDGFMDPKKAGPTNRCYTIYAGSRSGKGIMTSTLIASALADGKQVFYTDGKPENGPSLGMIAWEKGREAYVFDGQKEGQAPFAGAMENYTYGLRSGTDILASVKDLDKIPELFGQTFSSDDVLTYLGVMRYLKSLMLCVEMIEARASAKIPMDNWNIWVFDEMTSMSSNERSVREKFAEYCARNGVAFKNGAKRGQVACVANLSLKDIKDPGIINPSAMNYNAGIKFIYDWCQWTEVLQKKMVKANVISLGKSNTNLIFIFQEPTWIPKDENATSIAKIVKLLQSTKIAGRAGIQDGCGAYGDGTIKDDWKRKINIEGAGNWAMSHGADIRTSGVTLFKPFNIYTVPNQKDARDRKVPDGVPATNYLAGYTDKLLGHFGMDTSEVIESAYNYADESVKALGLSQIGVKNYIYDAANLSFNVEADLNSLYTDAISEMQELGIEIPEEAQQIVQNAGQRGSFTASSEEDLPVGDGPIGTSTPITTSEGNPAPIGTPTGGTPTNTSVDMPIDNTNLTGMDTPIVNDPRLEGVYETFNPEYTRIINTIEGKRDTLLNIPVKGENGGKFEKLKNEILRDFDGAFAIEKNKFFDKLRKTVKSTELYAVVSKEYSNRFKLDFERLKTEVGNLTYGGSNTDTDDTMTDGTMTDDTTTGDTTTGGITTSGTNHPVANQPNPNPNTFKGQRLVGKIDAEGQTFDLDEYETNRGFVKDSNNVKLLNHLVTLIIKDIKRQFGGIQEIEDVAVNAGGSLVINGFAYTPQFDDTLVQSMPPAKQQYYASGNLAKVVNIGAIVDTIIPYATALTVESPSVADSELFQRELGVKKKNYGTLFKSCRNLQIIRLPNEELTRDNPNSSSSGGGLGAKLAGLFGFGKGRKDDSNYVPNTASNDNGDSLADRIFDSKPVRVMTGALGWTLGVKAVVMAATIFGPWGLLFGAFAAAGAYKEIKKDNQAKTETRRSSRESGSQSDKSAKSDKSNKTGSGGFSGTYQKKN